MSGATEASRFYDPWVELYDLMVDWEGRLAREGPALVSALRSAGAGSVLDVACGTGRHLAYLADAGFEVAGADASRAMVQRAGLLLSKWGRLRLFEWSMSEPPGEALRAAAPFDCVLCLGNSFAHLVDDDAVSAALGNFHSLLSPGGVLVIGLKALALLRGRDASFLPLVKRRDQGADVLFVRFYDFQVAGPAEADFHMVIIGPGHPRLAEHGGMHHAATRLRVWMPGALVRAVQSAGLRDVKVAADLAGRPWRPGDGEDVFVIARRPDAGGRP